MGLKHRIVGRDCTLLVCLPVFVFLLICAAVPLSAQVALPAGWISIRLEQRRGSEIKVVPQNAVFHTGDLLRFRITSKTSGYLSVIDVGTTGETSPLFPGTTDRQTGNLLPGEVRSVPTEGDGWFEVSGPAGYDVLYFLVTATPLMLAPDNASEGHRPSSAPVRPEKGVPKSLTPRCDEEVFKARGDCIDKSAGVTSLGADAPLPSQMKPYSQMASRDIIVSEDEDGSGVRPPPSAKLPLIYSFRLAHVQ